MCDSDVNVWSGRTVAARRLWGGAGRRGEGGRDERRVESDSGAAGGSCGFGPSFACPWAAVPALAPAQIPVVIISTGLPGHRTRQKKPIYPLCVSAFALCVNVCRKVGGRGVWKNSWIIWTEKRGLGTRPSSWCSSKRKRGGVVVKEATFSELHDPLPQWDENIFQNKSMKGSKGNRLAVCLFLTIVLFVWDNQSPADVNVMQDTDTCRCACMHLCVWILYPGLNTAQVQRHLTSVSSGWLATMCSLCCRKLHIAEHPHFPTDSDTGILVTRVFCTFLFFQQLSITCFRSGVEMTFDYWGLKLSINQSNFICIAHIHKPQFVS